MSRPWRYRVLRMAHSTDKNSERAVLRILAEVTALEERIYSPKRHRPDCSRISTDSMPPKPISNFWLELSTFTSYRSKRTSVNIARIEQPHCSKNRIAFRIGETTMNTSKLLKIAVAFLVVMAMTCVSGFAREKYETIDATA